MTLQIVASRRRSEYSHPRHVKARCGRSRRAPAEIREPPGGALSLRPPSLLQRSLEAASHVSGTKVRAAEANIPYAASARRATLFITGGHVVHPRR